MTVFASENAGAIEPDFNEALRYMGAPRGDETGLQLLGEAKAILLDCVNYRAVFRETTVTAAADAVDLGFGSLESRALYKNLSCSHSAVVCAATLGAGFDRMMLRVSASRSALALALDALGSAAIEAWCNEIERRLGGNFHPRFSPGYGDLSLDTQPMFLDFVDAARKIALTSTASLMLTPVKSVTFVAGRKAEL